MAMFVVNARYIPERNEERLAARPAHRAWLTELHEQGRCYNAGPMADQKGALLLVQAPDEDGVRALLDADPYPKGSVEYTIAGEWLPLFPVA